LRAPRPRPLAQGHLRRRPATSAQKEKSRQLVALKGLPGLRRMIRLLRARPRQPSRREGSLVAGGSSVTFS